MTYATSVPVTRLDFADGFNYYGPGTNLTVTAVVNLPVDQITHTATGETLDDGALIPAQDATTFDVPNTKAGGWTVATGGHIRGWSYDLSLTITAPGEPVLLWSGTVWPERDTEVITPGMGETTAVASGEGVSVRTLGAKGDGVADDTAAIQAALNNTASAPVHFPAGTYRITAELAVPTGVTIEGHGATIDATGLPVGQSFAQVVAFRATGSDATGVAVSSTVAAKSTTVTGIGSTAAFSPGDLVVLYNQEQPVPGMTRTDKDKGELRVVKTVDSATQLTFTTGALFDYAANGTGIRRIDAVEDITIRDLRIIMGGVGSGHNGIRVVNGRNIQVHNVHVDGAEDSAINLSTVFRGRVTGCDIRNSTSPSYAVSGYGVSANDGSRDIRIEGNSFYNCRHFVAGGGKWPTVHTDVVGNHGEQSTGAAYDCHEPTFWWKFIGNTAIGVQGGLLIRGQHVLVESNSVTNCETHAYKADVWDGVTEQRGIRFLNNYALNSGFNGDAVDGTPRAGVPSLKIDTEIRGNVVDGSGYDGVLLRHFDGALVTDNTILNTSAAGLLALGLSGTQSRNLTWGGNTVRATTGVGVKAQYVDGVTGSGGRIDGATLHGLHLQNCNRTQTTGLAARSPGWSGVFIEGGSIHTLNGVNVSGGMNGSYDALRISASGNVTVNGGYYQSARRAIYSTTTDNVIVTGVNAKDTTSTDRINVDATTKVVVNNLV